MGVTSSRRPPIIPPPAPVRKRPARGCGVTFGSLFAGIGGMDLGLERAGLTCKWQVEIDPFCRRVLAKHWPDVPRHDDVRTFPDGPDIERWRVDLVAGGFPCQDISHAGGKAGIDGERSGLWGEFCRILGILRPRFAIVENVSALLDRGIGRVLGDLACIGFDAEWSIVSACSVGAPHLRERVFILAHPNGLGFQGIGAQRIRNDGASSRRRPCSRYIQAASFPGGCEGGAHWSSEPGVGRMVDGIPGRLDRCRLAALGNAVVPQVAEWIGRRILEHAEGGTP
jgi:DNA (cytosine-5)-methyltransferase 1